MRRIHVRVPWDLMDQYLPIVIEHKFNIELYISGAAMESIRPGEPEELLEKLTHGPSLSIHAPFMDLNPGAVDSEVLDVTRQRFRRIFGVAEVLGPVNIVFHSGYEKWKYDHDVDLWLERSLAFWPEFVERAEYIGSQIAVENIFEDEPSSLAALIKGVGSDNMGVCLDAGHANLFTDLPLTRWMEVLGPYIIETHLHDNNGDFDSHFPLGDGNIDFDAVLGPLVDRDMVHTIEATSPEDTFRSLEVLNQIFQRLST